MAFSVEGNWAVRQYIIFTDNIGFFVESQDLPDPSLAVSDPNYSGGTCSTNGSTDSISLKLRHFWNRWKKEYLLELLEFHRMNVNNGSTYVVSVGDVVTVYDDSHPMETRKSHRLHPWSGRRGSRCVRQGSIEEGIHEDFAQTPPAHIE